MRGLCYLVLLYLVAFAVSKQIPCPIRVQVNPADCLNGDPSIACSLEQAIAVCQNTTCDDQVACNIYSTKLLNGTGNTNLSYGAGSLNNIFSLQLNALHVHLDKGFFFEMMDTGIEQLSLNGANLQGGDQQSAIRIQMSSPTSIVDVSLHISNCSQGILEVDSPGQVNLGMVTVYTKKTGDCMVRVDAYNTTELGHTINNVLTGFDSQVTGDGGFFCLISHSEDVDIILPHLECTQCAADRGGVLFIQGPGKLLLENQFRSSAAVSARLGAFVYAEDFSSFAINRTEMQSSGITHADYGAVYAVSNRPNASFSIEYSALGPHSVHHSGGCLYLDSIEHVLINKVNFTDCSAANGTGGGVLFSNVADVHLIQSNFEACQARHGAAASCIGRTDNLVDYSIRAYRSSSTSLDAATLDFYTEGQCAGAIWDSQTACPYLPRMCKSCGGSICSVSDYGCFCYCDMAQDYMNTCPSPTSTPSPTPPSLPSPPQASLPPPESPSQSIPPPAFSASSSATINGTAESSGDGPGFWAGVGVGSLIVVILVVVVVVGLVLLNTHFKWHRQLRSPASVELIN